MSLADIINGARQTLSSDVSLAGHALHLPELGISEAISPTHANSYGPVSQPSAASSVQAQPVGGGGGVATGGGGGGTAVASPDDISFLNDQANQIRALLGRTDTALNQGLTQNEDEYNKNVGQAQTSHDTQVQDQNGQKLKAYDTINQNAGNSYRSLAQIIGHAAGTGSSAFQELLPNVVGKDTSSKRMDTSNTFGTNISKIDTSLQNAVANYLSQKKQNEDSIRSGVEGQRQQLNNELATNAGAIAQAKGGGYAAVKAAQAPYQTAIDNSRNAVEGFFNTFRTPYTPQAVNPDLSQYTTDRSVINAQNSGDPNTDPTNPYSALLRKKLQGAA